MTIQKVMLASSMAVLAMTLVGCAAPGMQGKEVLSTDQTYPAIGPYSQMIGHGKLIWFSGVIALNPEGTALQGTTTEEQTRATLENIKLQLHSQGLDFVDVVSATVYMKDLNDFAAMNRVYAEYFKQAPPVRSTVEVARIPRDAKIEIAVVAARR